jgi:hypothetical protein
MNWADHIFSRWRWWRRWRGGHWERWYIDTPVGSCLWFRERLWPDRPGLGRGQPEVEDYG